MIVSFSGLCVFAGWKKDGKFKIGESDVEVILTKSDPMYPHLPLVAIAGNSVEQASRNADVSFVGPGLVEFVGWHLGRHLTLPNPGQETLTLTGEQNVINLGELCREGGGELDLDPARAHVASSVKITNGMLTAVMAPGVQPGWNFISAEKEIKPNGGKGFQIADRIDYEVGNNSAGFQIKFSDVDPRKPDIELKLKNEAQVWVTNLSRIPQPPRELAIAPERDTLRDVAMHYLLFAKPPEKEKRFVPVVPAVPSARTDEHTPECVKELCRI
jgi:hypothetical protein